MELREMEERENGVVLLERKTKIKTRKNRKREKRKEKLKEGEEEAEELLQDPLDVFCKDIMLKILKSLNKRSITLSLLVSRTWNGIACSDMLWTSKCEKLWFGKAHIPRLSLIQGLSKLAAYSLSVMDGKHAHITKEDLCDHIWEFHFN
ncbi:uncharacterized protein LOC127899761 [Citrus sinensis]|uniref:uncharacterized protein LOC127899761 n=1 Tax=Citrus sinensis TaxID=2711 RepID=UPI0022796FC3|nr:uncharacterized protein LOC127899761 [Citrus sinensis]